MVDTKMPSPAHIKAVIEEFLFVLQQVMRSKIKDAKLSFI
jgi:hypothetical protein